MSHIQKIILLLLLVISFTSCNKEDVNQPITEVIEDPSYVHYGTEFTDIPATEDIILYEVNLRAFSANGDIASVTSRLDHIESLGVNVIWLMPIHPVGQIHSVNSPYSVSDYKAIAAEYGSLEDVRNLTEAAHARGISVIMDWVANHTAWDHPWIDNEGWYSTDGNGNIIIPAGTNWQDVADLDYNNNEMREAMIDAMKYWIYEANIDGFRCDYADGVPFTFWQQAINSVSSISDKEYIFFAEGNRDDHFTAGFDLSFGWQSYGAIKDVFNGQSTTRVYNADSDEYSGLSPDKQWVRFTTNHDESAWDATPISLFNGSNGALAASAVTFFTGGVPLIYGSQKVGVTNTIPFFSNTTFNWNSNPTMLASYKKMLQFYSVSPASRKGSKTIYSNDDVVCFKKTWNNEEIVIITNVRNNNVNLALPAALQNTAWTDVVSENPISLTNQLTLAPYQFYILKQ